VNEIVIRGLRVSVFIGVPDAERAAAQEIEIDVIIEPIVPFAELRDEISRTVDYAAAATRIVEVAGERSRQLIETLADEIAQMLLREFPSRSVSVEIRKFILPNTNHVAVRCRMSRGSC